MCTAFTHAFTGYALGRLTVGRKSKPAGGWRFWAAAMICAAAPDLDVILHEMGVPYDAVWGHRGVTHSLPFAAIVGILVTTIFFFRSAPIFRKSWWIYCLFFSVVTGTHGLLDAFTDGGLGIALLAPFTHERFFMPIRPLRVPGLGFGTILHPATLVSVASELVLVWFPVGITLLAARATGWTTRRRH